MSNAFTRALRRRPTQREPLAGKNTVANSAGGYSFELDQWGQLHRFLILGTEGGSYYASEQSLTVENAAIVDRCVADDPQRTVDIIVEVSSGGLAPKNTPAIFALAVCASANDPEARTAAGAALGQVCRIGTHLYQFVDFMKLLGRRGWGRGLRRSVARVLTDMPVERLALHAVKYRQREGWTYRDLLRLSHAVTDDADRNVLFGFMVGKPDRVELASRDSLSIVDAYLRLNELDPETQVGPAAALIEAHELPWEAVPDGFRRSPAIWEALLPSMGVTALTRNLATLARLGMLTPMSDIERHVVGVLNDQDRISASREHPVRFLDAQLVHASGGMAGRSRGAVYEANSSVLDALDQAFRLAFTNVEPSGARVYIGLDVSGSMGFRACAGSVVMTPRDGAAAMAIITADSEPLCHVAAFASHMEPVDITGSMTVRQAVSQTRGMRFGPTDCAQPMLDALDKGIEVDLFAIYTDSETWFGDVHPVDALNRYRKETGIPARLAVIGMVANRFTIADPDDAGMLDLVGFSASTPQVLSAFAGGNI